MLYACDCSYNSIVQCNIVQLSRGRYRVINVGRGHNSRHPRCAKGRRFCSPIHLGMEVGACPEASVSAHQFTWGRGLEHALRLEFLLTNSPGDGGLEHALRLEFLLTNSPGDGGWSMP